MIRLIFGVVIIIWIVMFIQGCMIPRTDSGGYGITRDIYCGYYSDRKLECHSFDYNCKEGWDTLYALCVQQKQKEGLTR